MDLLLVTVGSAGDVHPFVGLGRALRGRGHRVVVLTYPSFAELVQSAGLEYVLPAQAGSDAAKRAGLGPLLDSTPEGDGSPLAETGAAKHGPAPSATHLRGHRPPRRPRRDGRGGAPHGPRRARGARPPGVPLVSVHLAPAGLRSAHSPAVQPPLCFPRWAPRWFVRAAYWLLDVAVIDRVLGAPVNAFRRELGLAPVRRLYAGWKDSPQRVHRPLSGVVCSASTRLAAADPANGLFPFRRRRESRRPPRSVLSLRAIRRSCSRRRPRRDPAVGYSDRAWRPAANCGAGRWCSPASGSRSPTRCPKGSAGRSTAPFSYVLPRAAAVVHQGGIGTAAQALAAGVPQLVVPLKNDQFDNARRLERLGVARVSSRRDCTAAAMARHLDYLLTSPEVAARCRDYAGRLAAADALGETCRLIEEMRPPHAEAAA